MAKVLELQLQYQAFQWIFRKIQGWFPLELTGLISLLSKGLSKIFESINLKSKNLKASIFQHSAFFILQLSHRYMTTGKTIALATQTFVCNVMSLSMGLSRQEYWSGLPFPSPVDNILSEFFTVIHPSRVALHSLAHSFTQLPKSPRHNEAVIHEGEKQRRTW